MILAEAKAWLKLYFEVFEEYNMTAYPIVPHKSDFQS